MTPRPNMTFPFPTDMAYEIMGYRPADSEVTLGPGLSYEDFQTLTSDTINLSPPQIAKLVLWAAEDSQSDNEAYPPDEGRPDPLMDAFEPSTSACERFTGIIQFLASKIRLPNPYLPTEGDDVRLTHMQRAKIEVAVSQALRAL